ncbi:hypothetical protein H5410_045119, partial [Solanum commersonii]
IYLVNQDRYATRLKIGHSSSNSTYQCAGSPIASKTQRKIFISDVDLESLEVHPGIKKLIAGYNPNIRDEIRRFYIQKKKNLVNQRNMNFLKLNLERKCINFFLINLKFVCGWIVQHNKRYCILLVLLSILNERKSRGNMSDVAFTMNDFKNWNKALERFRAHVGDVNSVYDKCFKRMLDLMNQSIHTFFDKQLKKEKIDVIRFLLRLGLSFRGHDESQSSSK